MKQISIKQEVVLTSIKDYIRLHSYAPAVRELAEMLALKSPSTVHGHLLRLKAQGLIQWEPERPRTLKITGDHHAVRC